MTANVPSWRAEATEARRNTRTHCKRGHRLAVTLRQEGRHGRCGACKKLEKVPPASLQATNPGLFRQLQRDTRRARSPQQRLAIALAFWRVIAHPELDWRAVRRAS